MAELSFGREWRFSGSFGTREVRHPSDRIARFFLTLNGVQFSEDATALRQVERLGFKGSDVRHIVLTHLDFDHAGGLDDFPHAHVHVLAREHSAASDRKGFISRRRYRPSNGHNRRTWEDYTSDGEQWLGFGCVRDLRGLPPDILLVPLFGHTAGHCGVAIRYASGKWLLHAGDAYFYPRRDGGPSKMHSRIEVLPMDDGRGSPGAA